MKSQLLKLVIAAAAITAFSGASMARDDRDQFGLDLRQAPNLDGAAFIMQGLPQSRSTLIATLVRDRGGYILAWDPSTVGGDYRCNSQVSGNRDRVTITQFGCIYNGAPNPTRCSTTLIRAVDGYYYGNSQCNTYLPGDTFYTSKLVPGGLH